MVLYGHLKTDSKLNMWTLSYLTDGMLIKANRGGEKMIAILFLGNRNGYTTHIFFFSKVRLGLWTRIDFFFGKKLFFCQIVQWTSDK